MAGLLGDIFGAADATKRRLRDVVANPLLSAQQFVGNLNDRARNLNEMTAAAAREGVDYGPASRRLGGLLADAYNPMGLIVFHGSPAKFNRFDPTKIGSGEGAQAYGYGHYVAESPETAKSYKTAGLSKLQNPDAYASHVVQTYSNNPGKALRVLKKILPKDGATTPAGESSDLIKAAINSIETGAYKNKTTGNLYEIDLPDEQIARMLDYDKPLSQQPQAVQSYLKDAFNPYRNQLIAKDVGGNEPTGSLILNRLQELMSEGRKADVFTNAENLGARNASQELFDAGIPGIRYLDQNSRAGGAGTSNFVVFPGNENLLNIKKRNDDPLGLLD